MDICPLIRALLVEPVNEPVPEVIWPVEPPLPARIDLRKQPVTVGR